MMTGAANIDVEPCKASGEYDGEGQDNRTIIRMARFLLSVS